MVAVVVTAALPPAGAAVLKSDRLDGEHADLAADIESFSYGPMSVELVSPANLIQVHRHELELEAAENGGHRARLLIELEGWADLRARFDFGGIPGEMQDMVTLPLQTRSLEGEVDLERIDGGYLVTVVEAPSHAELEIESELAGRLVQLCEGMRLLVPGLDCGGVERVFSVVRLPLPKPGESFVIRDSALSDAERRQIDAYLSD